MLWLTWCLIFGFNFSTSKSQEENNRITIEDGEIIGKTVQLNDLKYNAYLGIPYAKPPIENLRFKAPEPNEKWKGQILNATQDSEVCLQTIGNNVIGSEDCLYINVYVPTRKNFNNTLLPVMVWIYGGGFIMGDSTNKSYNPEYFLRNDVIFVSFNYRLGIFGFISTGDEVASGNFGLKDQILALKWVQKNIEHFNGDKDLVTVFGESSGAISISYLTQLPQANGLFQKAIMQSGVSLCPWGLSRDAKETVKTIAQALFINDTNSQTIINGLRKINANDLQKISNEIYSAKSDFINPLLSVTFGPVIEPKVKGALMTEQSRELLKRGQFQRIPQIIGFNSQEGASIKLLYESLTTFLLTFDLKKDRFIPVDLNQNKTQNDEIVKQIIDYYFGDTPIIVAEEEYIQYSTDKLFVYPIYEAIRLISSYSPVYFYRFSYEGRLGNPNRQVAGVAHLEDNNYLFKRESDEELVDEMDRITREKLVKLWTNFAKFGNPTPVVLEENLLGNIAWPVLNNNSCGGLFTFLDIGVDLTLNTSLLHKELLQFWDKIYNTYGNRPSKPNHRLIK